MTTPLGDETELTCPPDSSASISKAEPISVFCTDAQCQNIAFACDKYLKVPNNDSIIEDNFENEVPRGSNGESFHFDVFQGDDKEIEFSRFDVAGVKTVNLSVSALTFSKVMIKKLNFPTLMFAGVMTVTM